MLDPLVLLPAMMSDARLFEAVLPDLSRRTCVTIGNYGDAHRIEDMATAVLGACPQRFALAGVELGGMVAMEIMRRTPQRVTKLALIDTSPLAELPEHAAAREPLIVAAKAGRLGEVMDQLRPHDAFAQSPSRPALRALLREMAADMGAGRFAAQTRALQRRRDQQGVLAALRCPTLVMCGAQDTIYAPRRHAFMAELIPDAWLQVIDGAGHMPILEAPDASIAALTTWLEDAKPMRK